MRILSRFLVFIICSAFHVPSNADQFSGNRNITINYNIFEENCSVKIAGTNNNTIDVGQVNIKENTYVYSSPKAIDLELSDCGYHTVEGLEISFVGIGNNGIDQNSPNVEFMAQVGTSGKGALIKLYKTNNQNDPWKRNEKITVSGINKGITSLLCDPIHINYLDCPTTTPVSTHTVTGFYYNVFMGAKDTLTSGLAVGSLNINITTL